MGQHSDSYGGEDWGSLTKLSEKNSYCQVKDFVVAERDDLPQKCKFILKQC